MKIRIAVAVAKDGSWNSQGWCDHGTQRPDSEFRASAAEGLPPDIGDHEYHVVFVEADVPLPTSVTVKGEVKP